MVFGTFDLLHPGHEHMLREAKAYGDYLVAIVARDSTVLQIKKRKAYCDEQTRLVNLQKLGIADKVRLGSEGNKYDVIHEEKPNVIALGYDQKFFVDDLEDAMDDDVQIVRLTPFLPAIYKSSKLRTDLDPV